MLGLLLWSSLNQIFFNSRCRDLLGYVGKVLVLPMPQEEKVCIFLQELLQVKMISIQAKFNENNISFSHKMFNIF